MTDLAKAFDGYACNKRVNLSTLLNAALNSTLGANGEINIAIGRSDALNPSTHIVTRSVGPDRWVIATAHQYRQQQNSTLPPTQQIVTDKKIIYEKLRSIISQNICQIHVTTSGGVKRSYFTNDLNLFS